MLVSHASLAPILLVDDSEDDVLFMRKAFAQADVPNPILSFTVAQEALDYLAGKGKYSDRTAFPLPALTFVDIKMPEISGFEFIRSVRQNAHSPNLIIIVLTNSRQVCDIQRAYEVGANSYLVKPSSILELVEVLKTTRDYWLNLNHSKLG